MATNDSEPVEVGAQSTSMNEIAIKAIHKGIAEQASRQEKFQLSLRVQGSPDEEAAKEFHQNLIEFIASKIDSGEVSIPEVAIALWDEVNRMEEMIREASEEVDGDADHDANDDRSEPDDDGDSPIAGLIEQPSTSDGEDVNDEDAEDAEANSGPSEDPAFH